MIRRKFATNCHGGVHTCKNGRKLPKVGTTSAIANHTVLRNGRRREKGGRLQREGGGVENHAREVSVVSEVCVAVLLKDAAGGGVWIEPHERVGGGTDDHWAGGISRAAHDRWLRREGQRE